MRKEKACLCEPVTVEKLKHKSLLRTLCLLERRLSLCQIIFHLSEEVKATLGETDITMIFHSQLVPRLTAASRCLTSTHPCLYHDTRSQNKLQLKPKNQPLNILKRTCFHPGVSGMVPNTE